ncbi:MAG: uracil-DNA glycosylase [Candidatus Marinimicrobia bacterium CG08_land_8_20_14_0_20_45_22]|nr:MAG: uracil-DNA glycosylase [Candidatus Marinimicrobia bacterium CG08_land_8_20_14_0_20_45_22]
MSEFRKKLTDYFRQQGELYPSEYFFDKVPGILRSQTGIFTVSETFLSDFRKLEEEAKNCSACDLAQTRTNVVFGDGNPKAGLLFIGEAPGENEDLQGKAFVGRAGKLLDDLLKGIGLNRTHIYITNIIKCRPPGNRQPVQTEVNACIHFLLRQIELIQPRMIVCLGLVAAKSLLKFDLPLGRMRNQIFAFQGIDAMVTYHPAAILRNVNLMDAAREDFEKIKQIYQEKSGS